MGKDKEMGGPRGRSNVLLSMRPKIHFLNTIKDKTLNHNSTKFIVTLQYLEDIFLHG